MKDDENEKQMLLQAPLLSIEDKVLFPRMYMRLSITSVVNLQLLKDLVWEVQGMKPSKKHQLFALAVFTQKPDSNELYDVGTLARVVQITRIRDQETNGLSVLLQGLHRIQLDSFIQETPYPVARVVQLSPSLPPKDKELNLLADRLKRLAQEFLKTTKNSIVLQKSSSLINTITTSSIGDLADVVTSYLDVDVLAKQRVLDAIEVTERLERVITLLEQELERNNLEKKIQSDVQDKMESTRREFLLRQQLEAIRKELGEADSDDQSDLTALEDRLQKLELEPKASKVVQRELRRLKTMAPQQPEHSVIHNYLEFFAELPWNATTSDSLSVEQVRQQLEQDHYGLDKVKKRIIEYIAVRSLKQDMKGPILCLVGPPGVGKTSLGKSIATATNRKFERIALGGVHDESEIRGHRKTYVGAMPGCILNALRHAESKNPVLLLDEVDKIGKDFRGDPTSALLEVLDPHQNHTFVDHYLNVPFDLSSVMFIATANSLETIPGPLLDRMEVIEISGYSVEQKIEIAKQYLVPRQVQENGLLRHLIEIPDDALRYLITSYTREAGVRDFERQIGALCRHVAVSTIGKLGDKLSKDDLHSKLMTLEPTVVDTKLMYEILGHELVFNEVALRSSVPGVATGMSWSAVGGSILFVEASCSRGSIGLNSTSTSPQLQLTGKLGDVMKESAQLALSWLRVHAPLIELPTSDRLSLDGITDLYVHFPEGAIPKDGPSAGAAIVCAMLSIVSGLAVPHDLAMTGEITLRGVILPVGGIREKVLAAVRAGIQRIILPRGNQNEANDLKQEMLNANGEQKATELVFVSDLRELVALVFGMKLHDDAPPRWSMDHKTAPMLLSML